MPARSSRRHTPGPSRCCGARKRPGVIARRDPTSAAPASTTNSSSAHRLGGAGRWSSARRRAQIPARRKLRCVAVRCPRGKHRTARPQRLTCPTRVPRYSTIPEMRRQCGRPSIPSADSVPRPGGVYTSCSNTGCRAAASVANSACSSDRKPTRVDGARNLRRDFRCWPGSLHRAGGSGSGPLPRPGCRSSTPELDRAHSAAGCAPSKRARRRLRLPGDGTRRVPKGPRAPGTRQRARNFALVHAAAGGVASRLQPTPEPATFLR